MACGFAIGAHFDQDKFVLWVAFNNDGGPIPPLFAITDGDIAINEGLELLLLLSPRKNAVIETCAMPIKVEKSKFSSILR
mmetsp:Transcript_35145/g.41939  ORF Transcript_35145/g.41939 Transcript_35145/m.41939 type:complete len:80 (-) Transcript_35145:463-702(-)